MSRTTGSGGSRGGEQGRKENWRALLTSESAISEVSIHFILLILIEHLNIYTVLSARDPGVNKRDMIPALDEMKHHQGIQELSRSSH